MSLHQAGSVATVRSAPRRDTARRPFQMLTVIRAAWVVLAVLNVFQFIYSVPDYFAFLGPLAQATFTANSPIKVVFVLDLLVALASLVSALACLVLAGVLFRRASENTVVLFASFYLLVYGIIQSCPVERLAALHAGWGRNTLSLNMALALLFTTPWVTLLVLFPTWTAVPRWTGWLPPVSLFLILPTLSPARFYGSGTRSVLASALLCLWGVLLLLALYAQIFRYRFVSSASEQRQSRRVIVGLVVWILMAAVLALPYAWLVGRGPNVPIPAWAPVAGVSLWLWVDILPLVLTMAVLRYRLWAIDTMINRTLVYGALTAMVVGLYMLIVGAFGALMEARGNVLVSLGATGLVALLFQPLRDRVQKGANRLLYGERDDPYAVITRLGARLEATLVPEDVLPTIVATVREALKLQYAAITLRQGEAYELAAAAGDAPPVRPVPPGVGRDERADDRPSLLVLPLVYQQAAVGQLLLAPRAQGETFSPADHRLLADLARQAGVAAHAVRVTLDRQRLTVDLQQSREQIITAREEERRRLRRDLHDGVGPTLASLVQRIDTARTLVPDEPAAATALLGELKGQVKVTIGDIRRLVYALRPPALDEFGLVSAIREHAAHYNESNGLRVAIDAPDVLPPLSAAVEVAAYRIVLEALTNVVRHAQAHRCCIRLDLADGLCLEISDDGVGLPPDVRAGVGLASMRERAVELGGDYRIEPGRLGGTRVCARLPLAAFQPVNEG